VAWADSPSGGGTDSDSSQHSGADTGPSKETTTSPRTKGPLSKLGERVRQGLKDAAETADRAGDALKRAGAANARPPADKPEGASSTRDRTKPGDNRRPQRTTRPSVTTEQVSGGQETPSTSGPTNIVTKVRDVAEVVTQRTPDPVASVDRTPTGTPANRIPAVATGPVVTLFSAAPPVRQPEQTRPEQTIPKLVSSLLAVTGLAPLAGSGPLAPTEPPALLALLAWGRRESERAVNPTGRVTSAANVAPVAALVVDPNQQTPKPAAPVVGPTNPLGWVTGGDITNAPSGWPGGYGIAGTDLGIMWDDGDGNILSLFGDTFDQPGMTGVWRNNVLLRSVDRDLSDGLQFTDAVISPGGNYALNRWDGNFGATQVIRDPGFVGLFGSTTTIIPTAAISVTDESGKTTQYANVMSVRTWDTPGRWTTNWSAIAYSEDGGKTWTVDPNTVRSSGWLRSSTPYVPGNQNFQQGAFVKGPAGDVDPAGTQYVYSFGTPSGRGGSAYVARVAEDDIRDLGAYEYWAGDDQGWVRGDPSVAVPVIGATSQSPPPSGFVGWITKAVNDFLGGIVVGGLTGGNVGELSVQYNPYLDQYVALTTDGSNNIVMRVSDSPQGVWSEPTVLVANNPVGPNTGMYAPMIHPWSGTDQLDGDESILYWNLSYWGPYNVQLMETDLAPMREGASASGITLV
jgi:hypothetical protein